MVFNSYLFILFFAVVFSLYWLLPGWGARKGLLLFASYVFYGAWSPPYVVLLLASTALDWSLARLLGRCDHPHRRRLLLTASLAGNLGLLGYFKYGDFLLDNFAAFLSVAGVDYCPPEAGILLPIGISFYTFASLSYTIDVYRRETHADWKFADYALFVSFFPHLVAGPILCARALLPQIAVPRTPTFNEVGWGLALLCFGLFCKVVMADALFAPVVDAVYARPAQFGMADTWVAVLAFSGQIYFDFNGQLRGPCRVMGPYGPVGGGDHMPCRDVSFLGWRAACLHLFPVLSGRCHACHGSRCWQQVRSYSWQGQLFSKCA